MRIRRYLAGNTVRSYIILFIIVFLIPINAQSGRLLDRVVAVVNDEVITLSELNQEAAPFLKQVRERVPQARQANQENQVRQEVLEKMIDQELIRQAAAREHISVNDEEIDATLARIAASNDTTVEEIKRQLEDSGASLENYRENIRMQILRSKLIGRNIRAKTVVSDEQIKDFYENTYARDYQKEGYHLMQFGAGWNGKGRHESKREAWKSAKTMRTRIQNGENFAEIARQHSDLPSASEGGDIGIFKKDELAPYMRKAVKDLQPGELSPIIETRSGFQFFLLLGSREGGTTLKAPLKVVRENIREKLYRQSLESRFEKWTKELREEAYIKKLL